MAVDVGMKVLIVDDYPTMLKVLKSLLRQLKFTNISEASNAKDALSMLREGGFGLVISDWNMEPMSGYELLQEVRADDALKDLPFILVTAESTTEKVIAAKQAGVSNYIIKPYTAGTLKTKLVSVLGEF
ncbi:MAG: response regulator [Rhodospirillales bacterium]|nr:response regulator [Rhodospirillales bacterium]MBO6787396.1 response regulator [Rhodospirillales bacterium]